MIHSQINTQWSWFDLSMPPKVKCNGVNWKTIYDLLYVFHALICPWAQWTAPHAPSRNIYETDLILLLGSIPTWKVDATITKLGWTTYITPFSKWTPAKWNYVFAYNPKSRIDRDKILLSDEVISWPLGKLPSSTATWVGINGPWNHGVGVCHQKLFIEVQQSLRTNLSWWMWWMKSGAQMPMLQSLCWERCYPNCKVTANCWKVMIG